MLYTIYIYLIHTCRGYCVQECLGSLSALLNKYGFEGSCSSYGYADEYDDIEGNGLFTPHIGKFIYPLIISRYYIVSIEEEFSHKHINKHSHLYFTQLAFYISILCYIVVGEISTLYHS